MIKHNTLIPNGSSAGVIKSMINNDYLGYCSKWFDQLLIVEQTGDYRLLEKAIRYMIRKRSKILIDDISYLNEPEVQDHPITCMMIELILWENSGYAEDILGAAIDHKNSGDYTIVLSAGIPPMLHKLGSFVYSLVGCDFNDDILEDLSNFPKDVKKNMCEAMLLAITFDTYSPTFVHTNAISLISASQDVVISESQGAILSSMFPGVFVHDVPTYNNPPTMSGRKTTVPDSIPSERKLEVQLFLDHLTGSPYSTCEIFGEGKMDILNMLCSCESEFDDYTHRLLAGEINTNETIPHKFTARYDYRIFNNPTIFFDNLESLINWVSDCPEQMRQSTFGGEIINIELSESIRTNIDLFPEWFKSTGMGNMLSQPTPQLQFEVMGKSLIEYWMDAPSVSSKYPWIVAVLDTAIQNLVLSSRASCCLGEMPLSEESIMILIEYVCAGNAYHNTRRLSIPADSSDDFGIYVHFLYMYTKHIFFDDFKPDLNITMAVLNEVPSDLILTRNLLKEIL